MHPKRYFWYYIILKISAFATLIGEIWLGVHLFSWWPGLFIFVPITIVVDLAAARIHTLTGLTVGALFVVAGLIGIGVQ